MKITSIIPAWFRALSNHFRAADRRALVRAIEQAEQRVSDLREELDFLDRTSI